MDPEDAEQLVAKLCTLAGMMMEDALPTALFRPANAEETKSNLESLSTTAADLTALVSAAQVVLRRSC